MNDNSTHAVEPERAKRLDDCPAVGIDGNHSEDWFAGEVCAWCGELGPELIVDRKTLRRAEFFAALDRRLDEGARAYGDRSFDRPAAELLTELEQEALDLAGWGFVLWTKIQKMQARASAEEVLRKSELKGTDHERSRKIG